MKSMLLSLAVLTSFSFAQAQELQTRGGQGTFVVKSAQVVDLDQGMSQCEFQVAVVDFIPDVACSSADAETISRVGTCEQAIENVIFEAAVVDGECSVKSGDVILSTTNQYFSSTDAKSPGLFSWIQLNAGYSSGLIFPNYGK